MAADNVNALIVDDSITYRIILKEVMKTIPNVTVMDTAHNGQAALDKIKTMPVNLVLLDIEMPVLNGIETLKIIKKLHPEVVVVIISSANKQAADVTIESLNLGAFDFIQKPDYESSQKNFDYLAEHLTNIVNSIQLIEKHAPLRSMRTAQEPSRHVDSTLKSVDVVAVGVSTGGPQALQTLFSKMPNTLDIPILVVIHMPPFFTESLAEHLNKTCSLNVREATEGELIKRNTVYIAPGNYHMTVTTTAEGKCIALNQNPQEHGCRPAADVLFESVAQSYYQNIICVVLTGMGYDGTRGARAIQANPNNYCITQDEASSVVYGMPRSVAESGLSNEIVPIEDIASRIQALVTATRRG